MRILLHSSAVVDSIRIPPVHEFTDEDVRLLHELIPTLDVLVTQPVRDDYRGLPLGRSQTSALLPRTGACVTFPVLRYEGLFPFQAIVRDPLDPSRVPPVVPYHDLRILAAAARGLRTPLTPTADQEAFREIARGSVEQTRVREEHHQTVTISDALAEAPLWHTVNHPSNATLETVAQRVMDHIEPGARVTAPTDREMLGELRAPVEPVVAEALGVEVEGRATWMRRAADGYHPIPDEEITAAHLDFYAQYPTTVQAGLHRHATRMQLLGLADA